MEYRFRLRDLREDADLNQTQVAEYIGINQRTYSNYETGKRSMPIEHYRKLAFLYQTSVDYLIGITEQSAPYPRTKQQK